MIIDQIKAEIRNKNYSLVLELMENVPSDERNAEYFLLRGICIQVSDPINFNVPETESSLHKAIELDPDYKDAKLELAYFYLNVMHDPSSAKKYFLEVLQATRDDIPSGLSSLMETSHELKETNSTFTNTLKLQAETFLSQPDNK
jgi:hypothetical protein